MIKHIDYFVPKERVSVETIFSEVNKENLPVFFETQEDGISFFENILKLKEVSDAQSMTEFDLLDTLFQKNFNEKAINPLEVDLIILIDDALKRGGRIPNLGQFMQYNYGFKNAEILVLSGNHCANIEYAISYGELLLNSKEINSILIIGINKMANYAERLIGNYAILGDGIGMVLLSSDVKNTGIKVNGSFSKTNGSFYKADMETVPPIILYKNYMMCIAGLLKKDKLKPSVFSEVIIQNANSSGIIECLKGLGFNSNQVNLDNNTKYGHLDCIDFVVNLKTILTQKVTPSSKILSFGNGYAGSNICLNLEVI